MKEKYIITNNECMQKGLNIDEFAIDTTMTYAIIISAIDLLNTRILKMNDNLKGEKALEDFLGDNEEKIRAYKKAQYRVIYNMIFLGDTDPLNKQVEDIIVFDLGCGKINGFQKGVF